MGPETIVGIMVERSVEMIVGIMGILKSGGAYLPMDPNYPQERIDYMLKDSGAKLSVTNNDLEKLPDFPTSQLPNFRPSPAASFAYVIYITNTYIHLYVYKCCDCPQASVHSCVRLSTSPRPD